MARSSNVHISGACSSSSFLKAPPARPLGTANLRPLTTAPASHHGIVLWQQPAQRPLTTAPS
eukprot:5453800-Alexandrium_andersonii.AAC.1